MDMIEGNKLIAEFMGFEKETIPSPFKGEPDLEAYWQSNNLYHIKNLNYSEDWALLMPVFEKIEKLGFASYIEKVAFTSSVIHRVWFVNLEGKRKDCGASRSDIKIEAVWQSVVAFIQWYNQQKEVT